MQFISENIKRLSFSRTRTGYVTNVFEFYVNKEYILILVLQLKCHNTEGTETENKFQGKKVHKVTMV